MMGPARLTAVMKRRHRVEQIEERVKAYFEAHNNHDVEAVKALFSDDICIEIAGVFKKQGRQEVRKLVEWDAATRSQLTPTDGRIEGDTYVCRAVEENDWLTLAGVGAARYSRARITVAGGSITKVSTELAPDSANAMAEALGKIIGWASQEHRDELADLMPGGEFAYSTEKAAGWMAVLKEWRKTQP